MNISDIIAIFKNRMEREKIYSTPEYWDSKANKYAGQAVSMWPNNNLNYYYHNEVVSSIEKYLPNVSGAKVLDIGCGTGRISRYFSERGAKVLGIDFSAKSIEIARLQSPKDNPCYRVQSVFDLCEQNAFNIAVSWGTIAIACKNRAELLDALVRLRKVLLKPNGKVLLLEPVHKGFLHRVLNMDIKEFCQVMVEAGLKIEEITNLHFWPMRLALAYIPWPRFITAIGYHSGQWTMNLFGNKVLGDYKAVYASISGVE